MFICLSVITDICKTVNYFPYMEKSKAHKETLAEKEPDIVEKIKAHIRQEKEKQKVDMEKRRKKEEEINCEDYYLSENDEPEEDVGYITLTGEQADRFEEEERIAILKYRKQKEKEKRKEKRENLKQALEKPLSPLPKRDLCEYEKIREQIIKEINEYMAKYQFYENLEKAKKDMG